ncbi:MAG: glycosyltransferase, partial [Salegentibacter sp.]
GGSVRRREQDIAYEHSHLSFTEVPSFNFLSLLSSIKSFVKIPYIFLKLIGAMRRAEHLHLRCPGNIGLLACIVQIFFPSKPKSAKYAGNWDPQAEQPWSYRFQKWILSNTFLTRNMQVLVYGEWPGQTKNVLPFFTASFSEKERAEVQKKAFSGSFTFLFVGNLVEGKRPLDAIKIVEELNLRLKEGTNREIRANSVRARLEIYGDGPEREKLEIHVKKNQLEEFVTFKASRPLEELKKAYQKAHVVILPSKSEGWPKALAEGMFFGCIPIATPVSCVPWMLDFGNRGILLSDQANGQKLKANSSNEWSGVSGQWAGDLEKFRNLLTDPERMKRMSEEAKKWSQQYTMERFEAAVIGILEKSKEKSSSPFGRACRPRGGGGVG